MTPLATTQMNSGSVKGFFGPASWTRIASRLVASITGHNLFGSILGPPIYGSPHILYTIITPKPARRPLKARSFAAQSRLGSWLQLVVTTPVLAEGGWTAEPGVTTAQDPPFNQHVRQQLQLPTSTSLCMPSSWADPGKPQPTCNSPTWVTIPSHSCASPNRVHMFCYLVVSTSRVDVQPKQHLLPEQTDACLKASMISSGQQRRHQPFRSFSK